MRQIQRVQKRENAGDYGDWRNKLCKEYQELRSQVQHETHEAFLKTIELKEESIICKKGCTYCCFQHITAPLAEGMVIINYLYSNQKILEQFLRNYDKWKHKARGISNRIDQIRLQYMSMPQSSLSQLHSTDTLSDRYFEMKIPCPFLLNNACAIYQLRPMCCACHYSVSQPEWCSPENPNKPIIYEALPSEMHIYRLATFIDPRFLIYQYTLPVLIHRFLNEGLTPLLKEIETAEQAN